MLVGRCHRLTVPGHEPGALPSAGLPNIDYVDVEAGGTPPQPTNAPHVATNGNDSTAGTACRRRGICYVSVAARRPCPGRCA